MAIPTSFEIVHSCGHSNTVDLSSRSADQRAGYARWLATRQCTDCWRADHQADAASTAEWLAAKRADEQAAAADWATQFDMPPLEGLEKILGWAERTRHQLVTRAYTALVTEGFPVKSSVSKASGRRRCHGAHESTPRCRTREWQRSASLAGPTPSPRPQTTHAPP
ncbi:hypothetical protein [Streptomyces antibioticus]|uniref:Uncharacterized protein n=1 Tax=Streptomyces antibioticus TaxID=1890 RepID=A0AAE6Y682_STRAT|nr:hypothetical protein [Streptomyces antibioticus]QIT42984.1 hypothetical protein HCX60_05130 [Streptomyces antibioticus]